MKKLIFISLLFSILSLSVSAQKPTKAEKAAQLEQEFQQTRQFISNSNSTGYIPRVAKISAVSIPEVSSLLPTRSLKVPFPFSAGLIPFPTVKAEALNSTGWWRTNPWKSNTKRKEKSWFTVFLSPPKTIHTRFPWKFQEVGIAR